ncbi:hypothetical protein QBC38DRAFT_109451 [Podospora fimiseda]|uniref:Voltage-gated hydrogen channel 1 n=1 Tax=Podospora fimiseda TaxID=252190 RepID=A0AAN7BTS7_9PEZI|nr:hypothetical protein QBC38DRAFT_109451 [Podospora fimiseda]
MQSSRTRRNEFPFPSSNQPLLDDQNTRLYPPYAERRSSSSYSSSSESNTYTQYKQKTREVLSSKYKRYFIVGLVSLDVSVVLGEIFITLVACDLGLDEEKGWWVHEVKEVILRRVGVVLSWVFLGELVGSWWAFGVGFFNEWFHCLDAAVILISFIVDVFVKGLVQEIVSIVIVLRLWRFIKIAQEVSVGAAERTEELEGRIVELERECEELRGRLYWAE